MSLLALQFLAFHVLVALALNLKDAHAVNDDSLCANTEFGGKVMQVQRNNENGMKCTVKLGIDGKVTMEGVSSDAALCRTLRGALRGRSARGCVCHEKRYENLSKVGRYPNRFCINGEIIVVNIMFYGTYGVEAWLGK